MERLLCEEHRKRGPILNRPSLASLNESRLRLLYSFVCINLNIPAPGNRRSGNLEITIPEFWKSSLRHSGNHFARIPAPGNRRSGVLETGIPEIWEPAFRRFGNRCPAGAKSVARQRSQSDHSLRFLSRPYTSRMDR